MSEKEYMELSQIAQQLDEIHGAITESLEQVEKLAEIVSSRMEVVNMKGED